MTLTHGSSYSAINLFYNGGWSLKDEDTPAFWKFENLATSGLNNYKLTDRGIRITLGSVAVSAMYQDFLSLTVPMDFQLPAEGGLYRTLAAGYHVAEARPIPANTTVTIAFDVTREVGDVRFKVFYTSGIFRGFADAVQRVSLKNKTRLVFILPMAFVPEKIGIELQADKTSTVVLDKIMLSVGSYSELPYTGDPFVQVFPAGCIVLTLGQVCPAGFKELGEDDLTAPAEWEKHEPGVKARKGNYPRSGTELSGSPVHTVANPQMQNGAEDFREFEGFEGKLFTEHSDQDPSTPAASRVFTVYAGNPNVDDYRPHTHKISEGGSRPLSLGLLFCKRL